MRTKALFVTGTDTNVGKTWATISLMRHLQNKGLIVNPWKPVAAGCIEHSGHLINPDVSFMQTFASSSLSSAEINPYSFLKATSPHHASNGICLDPVVLKKSYENIRLRSDYVVVEGAGGWCSPVDGQWLNADLAQLLNLPVLLVVGLRLGCINHALLTAHAIKNSGLACVAWLAVVLEPGMTAIESNLDYLHQRLDMPCIGVLPHLSEPDFGFLAEMISLDMLKN